jgi:hypothetical protein
MYTKDQDYEITHYLAEQEELQQRDLGHLTGTEVEIDGTDLYIILKAVAIYQKHTYEPSVVKEAWDRFAKFAQSQFPGRFDQDELERIWKMDTDC